MVLPSASQWNNGSELGVISITLTITGIMILLVGNQLVVLVGKLPCFWRMAGLIYFGRVVMFKIYLLTCDVVPHLSCH